MGEGVRLLSDGFHFLAGSGYMAVQVRRFPWSLTPIGAPESWTPTLRTTVRLMLANKLPQQLYWGPDYIQIHNDAYLFLLGDGQPASLGRRAADCWPERWSELRPLIESPFHAGLSACVEKMEWHVKRNGWMRETYFRAVYSPVPDESVMSGIGGVLTTVSEITAETIAERRMRTIEELQHWTAKAGSAGAACASACSVLSDNTKDVPFSLLYLVEDDDRAGDLAARPETSLGARLAAHYGCEANSRVFAPALIALTPGVRDRWPLTRVKETSEIEIVQDLQRTFGEVPEGPWSDPPNRAAILPLLSGLDGRCHGFWIAGISSRIPFDGAYRSFLNLARRPISEAIGSARAHSEAKRRGREQRLCDEQLQALERIASGHQIDAVFSGLTEAVSRLAPGARACIVSATQDGKEIERAYAAKLPESFREPLRGLRLRDEDIANCQGAVYSDDGTASSRTGQSRHYAEFWKDLCLKHGIRAFHSQPIRAEDRNSVAALFLGFDEAREASQWELRVAKTVAQIAGLAMGRKRAEENAADSSSLLSDLIERSPFGIYVVDSSFRIAMMNRRSQDGAFANVRPLLGRRFEEAMRILWPEEVAVEILRHFRRTLESGEPFRSSDFVHPRGDTREVEGYEWELHRMRLPGGQYGVICYYYDSTELRQTQNALREQLRLTEAITRNAAVALFITDERQRCIYVNPAAEKLTGFTARALLGGNLHEVLHHSRPDGSVYPSEECPILNASSRAGRSEGEEVFVRPDGRFYPIHFTASPMREGDAVIGTVIEVQDIGGRKRAEALLSDREQQLALVSNTVPALIYYLDEAGHYQSVNDGFVRWFGVERDEVIGRSVQAFVGERAWQVIQPKLAEAYAGKVVEFEAEIPYRLGGWRWVHAVYTPHCDAAGKVLGVVALKTDIHQNKTTELELRRANEDLEQFAYSASHDLQEPIRNVALFSQLFQAHYGERLDEDGKRLLYFMTEGAQRMSMLVSDLLSYTQAARMHSQPPEATPAERALQSVLRSLTQQIESSGAVITHDSLPEVPVEEVHLQQLFQNLVGNAIKYGKPGEAPRVHIGTARAGNFWRFHVRDEGIGIEAGYHEQVFGLFKRLNASRERGGTGIGLAICQKIVERYGGKIWVESEPGNGSSFLFLLPRSAKADDD
jgi:PAS domain S-box-containing protein